MYSFDKVQILGFLDNTSSFRRFHVASARYSFYLVFVKESPLQFFSESSMHYRKTVNPINKGG